MSSSPFARVIQRYTAPPERVFDAWLDPAWIGKFLFGPTVREEAIVHLKTDARVGGRFSFLVRRRAPARPRHPGAGPSGRPPGPPDEVEIDHVGEYLELERPHRLAFTWGTTADGSVSRVTLDFATTAEGCALSLTHALEPAWEEHATRIEDSWRKMLGALGEQLARG